MRGTPSPMLSRRLFLSMAVAGLAGVPARPRPQSGPKMIVRATRPEDLEMPEDGFSNFITPVDQFFVRTHVPVPQVDLATWRLTVDGHVSAPMTLSLDELRRMPSFELPAVLECAGNGRGFFDPPVAGLQWMNGAIGNGRWRGVRLRDLLERAQVKPGAVEILFDGADRPIGTMPDFQRSIPLKKALHPSTILAYEMNGEMLPVKHGFPLRAVVPGWAGNSWVKWITNARVLSEPSDGFWMKNAYLYPSRPIAPGSTPDAAMMRPVTSLRIKSIISSPSHQSIVEVGKPLRIAGAAWTGEEGHVSGVDVSTDGGRTWQSAKLTGGAAAFSWRLWKFDWIPRKEGPFTVLSRARDSGGDVQPGVQQWNPNGYLWNAVGRLDLLAGATAERVAVVPADALAVASPTGFRNTCLICHDEDVIRQQHLTRAQWDREVNKMIGWGARLQPDERDTFLDYLLGMAARR
jgi:sulfite oxidase